MNVLGGPVIGLLAVSASCNSVKMLTSLKARTRSIMSMKQIIKMRAALLWQLAVALFWRLKRVRREEISSPRQKREKIVIVLKWIRLREGAFYSLKTLKRYPWIGCMWKKISLTFLVEEFYLMKKNLDRLLILVYLRFWLRDRIRKSIQAQIVYFRIVQIEIAC